MVTPPPRTDGGPARKGHDATILTVRARVSGSEGSPVWDGTSAGAQVSTSTTSGAPGSIIRRIVSGDRSVRDETRPSDIGSVAQPHPSEAELAESLGTVLGIVGRLAASHDRAEL